MPGCVESPELPTGVSMDDELHKLHIEEDGFLFHLEVYFSQLKVDVCGMLHLLVSPPVCNYNSSRGRCSHAP